MKLTALALILLMVILLPKVGLSDEAASDRQIRAIHLLCKNDRSANCLPQDCVKDDDCPLLAALRDDGIFKFVQSFSCDDCNTSQFSLESGIGRCLEYSRSDLGSEWILRFSGSQKCSFRFGSPEKAVVEAVVSKKTKAVTRIKPDSKFLNDSNYCNVDKDCKCLAGSGVEFIGCSNSIYSLLNWTGDFSCTKCACVSNSCRAI